MPNVRVAATDGAPTGAPRSPHDGAPALPSHTGVAAPVAAPASPIPELDPLFEILGELGRGGSAVVYLARDRHLDRTVALKVVRLAAALPEGEKRERISRLAREARTIARLAHPHIVGVHAVHELPDGLAVVMPHVQGPTLKQLVAAEGALPPARAARLLADVAEALAHAHAHGLVHRDVKPENVFVEAATGRALLADFGAARADDADARVTRTGATVGTPAYMSPEQIDGAPLDGRADLYALGLVGWEALTGRRPWDGAGLYHVLHCQKHETLAPIARVRPAWAEPVPLPLAYTIERLLEKRPEARWATASEAAAQLVDPQPPPAFAEWTLHHEARLADPTASAGPVGAAVSTSASTELLPLRTLAAASEVALALADSRTSESAPSAGVPDGGAGEDTVPFAGAAQPRPRGARRTRVAVGLGAVLALGAALFVRRDEAASAAPGPRTAVAPDRVPAVEVPVRPPVAAEGADRVAEAATEPPSPPLPDAPEGATTAIATGEVGIRSEPVASAPSARRAVVPRSSSAPAALPQRTALPPRVPTPAEPAASATAPAAIAVERRTVAAGGRHTCALDAAGVARCWGANDDGQLGAGDLQDYESPVPVAGTLRFSRLASGGAFTCGVLRGGAAACWGDGEAGQLGDGTFVARATPAPVAGDLAFRTLETGLSHACGLTTAGAVACWGANDAGQLGDGTLRPRAVPRAVAGLRAASLAVGWRHACALDASGVARCWGANGDGQLGDGTQATRTAPVPVAGGLRFVALAAGRAHTCGVATDGATWCWGRLVGGPAASPARVPGAPAFVALAAGGVHTCGRTAAGAIWCWGRNPYGQLGDGSTSDRATPVRVAGGPYASLSAAGAHTCADADGGPVCWGYNVAGQLGDGTHAHRATPIRVTRGEP